MYDTYMFGVFPLGRSSILWRFDSARSIRQTGIHKIAFSKNSQKSYKRNIFNMKIVLRRAWKDAFNELSHVYMCAIWKIDWRPLLISGLVTIYKHTKWRKTMITLTTLLQLLVVIAIKHDRSLILKADLKLPNGIWQRGYLF